MAVAAVRESGRRAVPLLAGGTLLASGSALAYRELRRELPAPLQVVALHLEDPNVCRDLGFSVAPWSIRLWHGHVDNYFARLTIPLFEVQAPLPDLLPWLRVARWRCSVHAALQSHRSGSACCWELVS